MGEAQRISKKESNDELYIMCIVRATSFQTRVGTLQCGVLCTQNFNVFFY